MGKEFWEMQREVGWRNEMLPGSSGGAGGGWMRSSVSAAVLDASLMLEVVITVLTNTHR